MRGYLSVVGTESAEVPVESETEVYRDPGDTQEVLAAQGDEIYRLGVADATVSRKKNGTAPVVLNARDDCLEVRNRNNTNGVIVRTNRDETDIGEGHVERVRRDATIEIGYQTTLKLEVQRDARVEVRGGDYVAGNKVENRTEVRDSVVNRSEIGSATGDGAGKGSAVKDGREVTVDDSVVNRSKVATADDGSADGAGSDSDTREYCEEHERTYTGEECPACRGDRKPDAGDTKFCRYCGTEIPARVRVCPACDAELS
ncbi:MAG: hypothetical protein ABEJ40_05735 [Haloarculaceae archaeon]